MEELALINRDDLRVKQGVYTICFVLLCIIDMLMGSAVGRVQMTANNCTGLILGVITLTGYKWKDFYRVPYAIWAAVGGIATYLAITWGVANRNYKGQWVTAVLVAYLYGFIIIRLLYRFVVEKKYPKMNWPYFIFWCVMMLGMIFSRNDSLWPIMFLVCFGCFYLTDFSKENRDVLFNGALNGIIIGFLIIQGFATVFRAYDEVRYKGMYTNGNMNALFYLMVHTAILCKWWKFKKTGAGIGWRIFAAVGSGILIGYGMLTIGRTAIVCMIINMVSFVILSQITDKRRKFVLLKISTRLVSLVLVSALSLPIVFSVCRNIPAYFNSPFTVFFEEDLKDKIQESTDFDDEKYVTWEVFIEESFGRFGKLIQGSKDILNSQTKAGTKRMENFLFPIVIAYAGNDTKDMVEEKKTKREWGTGESKDDPVLKNRNDRVNNFLVRWAIYRTYWLKTNLTGHTNDEDGVWVSKWYLAPHAHNVFLQIVFSHGLVVGILFLIDVFFLFFATGVKMVWKRRGLWNYGVAFFFVLSFVGFGLFELDFHYGQLPFTMFFLVHYLLMHRDNRRVDV